MAAALAACKGGDETTASEATTPGTSTNPTQDTGATDDGPTGPGATESATGDGTSGPGPSSDPTTMGPTSDPSGDPSTDPSGDPSSDPTTDPSTTNATDPTTETGGDDSTLCATQWEGRFFPDDAWFYQDATQMQVAPDSDAITQWMVDYFGPGGWGTGEMRIDFSIVAVDAPAGTEKRTFDIEQDYYYVPDCDIAPMPLPPGGYVEDYPQDPPDPNDQWAGYDCSGFADGADCHMIVVSRSEQRLYEIYHATANQSEFIGGCQAVWDTSTAPTADGRGQQCTSADAAGFPIAPLLFTAEEVQAGVIDHAIRFILPNDMIRQMQYVYPATHGTNTSGPQTSIPYGGHMRLRADFPLDTLKPAAQVVARAMQQYGMYMSDGGNIALTAQADVVNCGATWAQVDLEPYDLSSLLATDFEVIDHGPTIPVTFDCQRTQITE